MGEDFFTTMSGHNGYSGPPPFYFKNLIIFIAIIVLIVLFVIFILSLLPNMLKNNIFLQNFFKNDKNNSSNKLTPEQSGDLKEIREKGFRIYECFGQEGSFGIEPQSGEEYIYILRMYGQEGEFCVSEFSSVQRNHWENKGEMKKYDCQIPMSLKYLNPREDNVLQYCIFKSSEGVTNDSKI